MKNVMVDLETLGKGSDAVILSIGAVAFDETGVGSDFYANIDPESCTRVGMKMDASTVMWWMTQGDQARQVFKDGSRLDIVLRNFTLWFASVGAENVWGNGATFDNVILSNAYTLAGLERPWSYRGDRCYRTLKALLPDVKAPPNFGTAHNALDDARYQAIHAVELLKALKK